MMRVARAAVLALEIEVDEAAMAAPGALGDDVDSWLPDCDVAATSAQEVHLKRTVLRQQAEVDGGGGGHAQTGQVL